MIYLKESKVKLSSEFEKISDKWEELKENKINRLDFIKFCGKSLGKTIGKKIIGKIFL